MEGGADLGRHAAGFGTGRVITGRLQIEKVRTVSVADRRIANASTQIDESYGRPLDYDSSRIENNTADGRGGSVLCINEWGCMNGDEKDGNEAKAPRAQNTERQASHSSLLR